MTLERIREMSENDPFVPYRLSLADGSRMTVHHRDFLWIHYKNPRTIIVAKPVGGLRIIDLLLVASIDVLGRKSRGGNGR